MKLIHFLTAFLALVFTTMAYAETPNRTNMSWREYVEASGCVVVDMGGYLNLAAADGGNCPFSVTQAWVGGWHKRVATTFPGEDGVLGTPDDVPGEIEVSDN